MKILARVRADYDWDLAQVGGVRFHKTNAVQLAPHELTDEIKNSPLLTIEYAADEPASIETETVEPEAVKTSNAKPSRRRA